MKNSEMDTINEKPTISTQSKGDGSNSEEHAKVMELSNNFYVEYFHRKISLHLHQWRNVFRADQIRKLEAMTQVCR